MNHLEELEMKWAVSKIILLIPIMLFGMFAILSFVLFSTQAAKLNEDCNSYIQEWKIQTCNEIKQTTIQIPLTMVGYGLGMFGFRELMKRTYYKELFRKQ